MAQKALFLQAIPGRIKTGCDSHVIVGACFRVYYCGS
jgi:hypothetical protein